MVVLLAAVSSPDGHVLPVESLRFRGNVPKSLFRFFNFTSTNQIDFPSVVIILFEGGSC